jgi:hypothetical protein
LSQKAYASLVVPAKLQYHVARRDQRSVDVRHEVLQRCRRMIQRGRESDHRGGVDRVFEALATTDLRSELVLQYVHVASCLLDGSSHGGKSATRRALRELQCFVVLMRRKQ